MTTISWKQTQNASKLKFFSIKLHWILFEKEEFLTEYTKNKTKQNDTYVNRYFYQKYTIPSKITATLFVDLFSHRSMKISGAKTHSSRLVLPQKFNCVNFLRHSLEQKTFIDKIYKGGGHRLAYNIYTSYRQFLVKLPFNVVVGGLEKIQLERLLYTILEEECETPFNFVDNLRRVALHTNTKKNLIFKLALDLHINMFFNWWHNHN